MLDIGFGEIVLIFGLALVVLGPEKLPRVAAQVGRWIGRARGMARQFREQLEEEVNLEEIRKSRPPSVTQTSTPVMQPLAAQPSAAPLPVPPPVAADATTGESSQPPAEPPQQVYPDHYSHAHPTDSLGRPIQPPTHGAGTVEAGQHDWVGGVTATDEPAETPPPAAYAPPHERGT